MTQNLMILVTNFSIGADNLGQKTSMLYLPLNHIQRILALIC